MPVSEYDQRILGITKELCLQLNIADYNPIFVSWEGFDSRSRVPVEFRYDECLIERNCVTLSAKMKDVLEPDEWRPIIASSLIFTKKSVCSSLCPCCYRNLSPRPKVAPHIPVVSVQPLPR